MVVVKSPAVIKFCGESPVTDASGSILLIFATAVIPLIGKLIDEIVNRVK
jgi:hypothetical protein